MSTCLQVYNPINENKINKKTMRKRNDPNIDESEMDNSISTIHILKQIAYKITTLCHISEIKW